jgi:hypothetical protein
MAMIVASQPLAAAADELSDLKMQLHAATKAIQTLERRVRALEAKKKKQHDAVALSAAPISPKMNTEPVAAASPVASASPPAKAGTVTAEIVAAPVVDPHEHLTVKVPGTADGYLEIYGTAQLDVIYDGNRVDPAWEATLRPSTIPVNCPPAGDDPGCGTRGITTLSVRQSTLGFRGFLPTEAGELKTQFEFNLFGTGDNAGKTDFRLEDVWASLGPFLAGYTGSLFTDPDIRPETLDFWGPSGMMSEPDPQLRYTPYDHGGAKIIVGLESPGFGLDLGKVADQIPELANTKEKTKYPDITTRFRIDEAWGHAQLAGVVRWISFYNTKTINGSPADTLLGWGVNFAGAWKTIGNDALTGQIAYGRGIATFSNDCCFDLGTDAQTRALALPLLNWMVYYNRWWSEKWRSVIGFSQNIQDNSAGQLESDQHKGSYASVNLLYYPLQSVMLGAEGLWGERVNKDGANATDKRVQFSTRLTF